MLKRKKMMMMNKIKCIKCAPNKNAEVCTLGTDLPSLQEAVGGYIEFVYPFDDNVCVMCNEEGKLEHLDWSRPLLDENNALYDVIAGTCYIMGITNDGGNRDLTDDEINHYMKLWKYPIEVFKWVLPKGINDDGFGTKEVIDIRPFDAETGRKVKAYGR